MTAKEQFITLPILPQLPLFFQPWWLDLVSDNWDVALSASAEGSLQGLWPFSMDRRLGFRIIRNPLLTPYLGPFFFSQRDEPYSSAGRTREAALTALWRQLPRWDSLDIETTTGFNDSSFFTGKGFSCTEKITYELDLTPDEALLFKALHSNHRNLIRQAGAGHELVSGNEYLPRLLELHRDTFVRKKKPYPFTPEKMKRLIEECGRREAGRITAARDGQGNITAALFTVWDRQKMYLLLSTVSPEQAHPGAVRLLIWDAIISAKRRGLKTFDFEGSMDPGIAAFFRRFGGQEKTYLCATCHRSLLWKWKRALLG